SCSCPACPAALPPARWAARGWPWAWTAPVRLLVPAHRAPSDASGATGKPHGSSKCQPWLRSRGHRRGCSAASARRSSTRRNVQSWVVLLLLDQLGRLDVLLGF